MSRDHYSFGDHGLLDPDTEEWYTAMARDPLTEVICHGFVRFALPFQNDGYPNDFCKSSRSARRRIMTRNIMRSGTS